MLAAQANLSLVTPAAPPDKGPRTRSAAAPGLRRLLGVVLGCSLLGLGVGAGVLPGQADAKVRTILAKA